jgi:hypothetical protein
MVNPTVKLKECGTYYGYMVHRRANQDACRACKDAVNAYKKAWRKRNPGKQSQYGRTSRNRKVTQSS